MLSIFLDMVERKKKNWAKKICKNVWLGTRLYSIMRLFENIAPGAFEIPG